MSETEEQPVAWRIRIGMQNLWSYCETESDADFYIKQGGVQRFEKQALYLRPATKKEDVDGNG